MKNTKIFLIAALLGTVLAGCQRVEEDTQKPDEKPVVEQGWTLTVQARINAETRAMSLGTEDNHVVVNTYWEAGEEVAVYVGGTFIGTLEVKEVDNDLATLTGVVQVEDEDHHLIVNNGSELLLLFPNRSDGTMTYMGQDGIVPGADGTMATGFDYATATLTVNKLDTNTHTITITESSTTLTSEQSVYRFSFRDSGELIPVKSLTVSSSQNKLVRSRTLGATGWTADYGSLTLTPDNSKFDENTYWMAIRNENTTEDDMYSFTIVGNDNKLYLVDKNIPAAALGEAGFISAQRITVSQKAFAPSTGDNPPTIDNANNVL